MENGKCVNCPGKYEWFEHVNNPYYFEIYEEPEWRTFDELKNRYFSAAAGMSRSKAMMEDAEIQFEALRLKVLDLANKAREKLQRLSEIALRPNPLSAVDYIDILIQSERSGGLPGFQSRVEQLEKTRKEAEILCKLNNSDSLQLFRQYEKNSPKNKDFITRVKTFFLKWIS